MRTRKYNDAYEHFKQINIRRKRYTFNIKIIVASVDYVYVFVGRSYGIFFVFMYI